MRLEANTSGRLRLDWNVRFPGKPVHFPVNSVLSGRRNSPADAASGLPPLAVYSPIHYQDLPELFMEFVSSLTGKSPSTIGFGSEGALTKGPFNALWPVVDLNIALVSMIVTTYPGFTTSAGHIGPNIRVDHDISMLVPEIWCRMRVHERDPRYMIAEGLLAEVKQFLGIRCLHVVRNDDAHFHVILPHSARHGVGRHLRDRGMAQNFCRLGVRAETGQGPAGVEVREDERDEKGFARAGNRQVPYVWGKGFDEPLPQRPDAHPCASRELEILVNAAVEMQAMPAWLGKAQSIAETVIAFCIEGATREIRLAPIARRDMRSLDPSLTLFAMRHEL